MSTLNSSLSYLRTVLDLRVARLRDHRAAGELGASAVELAVITAVIVGVAFALVFVIKGFVSTEQGQIKVQNG